MVYGGGGVMQSLWLLCPWVLSRFFALFLSCPDLSRVLVLHLLTSVSAKACLVEVNNTLIGAVGGGIDSYLMVLFALDSKSDVKHLFYTIPSCLG